MFYVNNFHPINRVYIFKDRKKYINSIIFTILFYYFFVNNHLTPPTTASDTDYARYSKQKKKNSGCHRSDNHCNRLYFEFDYS
jgi:hypothetical protein